MAARFGAIRSVIDRLNAFARGAVGASASVGYASEGDLVVALANSYGTDTIPARGFIQRGTAKARASSVSGEIGLDTPIPKLLERKAESYRAAIVEAVNTAGGWAEPLAPDTIERKGGDAQPLGGRLANLQIAVNS